jgi:SAM-dependent methyltransferase
MTSVSSQSSAPSLLQLASSQACCGSLWEAAYAQFETPEQEIRKFVRRLIHLGARSWPRDAKVVELFCGRGNGLHALDRLGFRHVEGVDQSATLLGQYVGPAQCYIADCRQLPFATGSKDIIVVQGGLHHLPSLPDDLRLTLAEIDRLLADQGTIVVVEPWLTPFLRLVHCLCRNSLVRRFSGKIDALATMIYHERQTYDQWLADSGIICTLFSEYFQTVTRRISWGKFMFVGRKSPSGLHRSHNVAA